MVRLWLLEGAEEVRVGVAVAEENAWVVSLGVWGPIGC